MRCCSLIIAAIAALPLLSQDAVAAQPQPHAAVSTEDTAVIIPLGGNAWGDTVWLRLSHPGKLAIAVVAMPTDAPADIDVTLGGVKRILHLPVHAEPQANNHTRFTAWFYPPEEGRWLLIACWDRPATHSWLTHLHSFLENFEPEQGDMDRSAYYGNQWIGDSTGRWTPLTRARFTGDNTARKGYRHDYQGGLYGDTFFLHNGGFFNNYTPLDTWFDRPAPQQPSPPLNIGDLP